MASVNALSGIGQRACLCRFGGFLLHSYCTSIVSLLQPGHSVDFLAAPFEVVSPNNFGSVTQNHRRHFHRDTKFKEIGGPRTAEGIAPFHRRLVPSRRLQMDRLALRRQIGFHPSASGCFRARHLERPAANQARLNAPFQLNKDLLLWPPMA